MSERELTVLKNGQLAVAVVPMEGEIMTGSSTIETTAIVRTETGDQLAVKVAQVGGGGGGGTDSYSDLTNKPKINSVTLSGNKSSSDLGLQDALESGTNIKTINNTSLLGSGNISVQPATTVETLTTTSVELASNTIYNGGELASVTLTLPNSIPADFICQVEFTSGTTPTTFTAPATLYFNGDACESGVFTPIASKRYCILIITDGVNPLGFVYEK